MPQYTYSCRVLLINPALHHGLEKSQGRGPPPLDIGLLRAAGNMQEKHVSVLTFLQRQRQTRIEDKVTEIMAWVVGNPQIQVCRRERLPGFEEMVVGRIRASFRKAAFCATRSQDRWQSHLPPSSLAIFEAGAPIDIGTVVVIPMR